MINRVALEGIDGSGKTTVAQELAERLEAEGLRVAIVSPYRLANKALGKDIYELWGTPEGDSQAITTLRSVIETAEQQAKSNDTDVIIYDRHWLTAFTEIGNSPDLVETWGDLYVPAALLRVAPAVAQRRIGNDERSAWSNLDAQHRYATMFGIMARRFTQHMIGIYRSDDDVSVEALARNIHWDMNIRR